MRAPGEPRSYVDGGGRQGRRKIKYFIFRCAGYDPCSGWRPLEAGLGHAPTQDPHARHIIVSPSVFLLPPRRSEILSLRVIAVWRDTRARIVCWAQTRPFVNRQVFSYLPPIL